MYGMYCGIASKQSMMYRIVAYCITFFSFEIDYLICGVGESRSAKSNHPDPRHLAAQR